MQPPSTVQQLAFLVLLVLPGVTYQFLRERRRGPVAGEAELGQRILRALTASVALDAVYVIIAGPALAETLLRPDRPPLSVLADHPRATGAWALVLFLGVPALAAECVSWWQRRHARAVYRSAPTAWDHLFGDRAHGGPAYIRARLTDGTWVGGWYDTRSYAAGYPHAADLYLQWAYQMKPDGGFGPPVEGTRGIYLRMENVDTLELIAPPTDEDDGRAPDGNG